MKKVFFILCALFLALSPLFARNRASLERRVQKQAQATQPNFYTIVEKELKQYYGADYVPDPQRKTGWYRVDDFLQWVKTHPQELEDMMGPSVYGEPHTRAILLGQSFWLQLGVRYIASVYGIKADFSKLPITFGVDDGRASSGKNWLRIFSESNKIVPVLINDGIHEGTHILPILSSGEISPYHHLDELATFYSQYNYGLPVKASDAQNFGQGIRDIRRTYALKGDVGLSREYNYFVAGIILNPQLTKREMLERYDGWSRDYTNMAIWTTVANLIAVRDGNYWELYDLDDEDMEGLHAIHQGVYDIYDHPGVHFCVGEYQLNSGQKIAVFVRFDKDWNEAFFEYGTSPTSEEEYLEKIFGDRAPALYAFYDALINNLPKEVIEAVRKLWPVQEDAMFNVPKDEYFAGWEKFGEPYSKEITQAVIKSLKEVNAPPVPPIPEGYM